MPTSTFFRLPEEKRQRLLDVAWEEFTRIRFTDVSINQIIHNAHIPRGSFYQYFEDKEDLFLYLVGDVRDHFTELLEQMLGEARGNLFEIPLRAFSHFVQYGSGTELTLQRFIRMLQINPGWDLQKALVEKPECLPGPLLEHIDVSLLRRQDRAFVGQVFAMLMMAVGSAVAETLAKPEQLETQRQLLQVRVEIIQSGSASQLETKPN